MHCRQIMVRIFFPAVMYIRVHDSLTRLQRIHVHVHYCISGVYSIRVYIHVYEGLHGYLLFQANSDICSFIVFPSNNCPNFLKYKQIIKPSKQQHLLENTKLHIHVLIYLLAVTCVHVFELSTCDILLPVVNTHTYHIIIITYAHVWFVNLPFYFVIQHSCYKLFIMIFYWIKVYWRYQVSISIIM